MPPQHLDNPQALAEALLKLEATVRENGVAMKAGLGELRRRLDALGQQVSGQSEHCQDCRSGLQAEILANEREARKREQAVAEEARTFARTMVHDFGEHIAKELADHENRLRWVERWVVKGAAAAAIIGAAVVMAGRLVLERVLR